RPSSSERGPTWCRTTTESDTHEPIQEASANEALGLSVFLLDRYCQICPANVSLSVPGSPMSSHLLGQSPEFQNGSQSLDNCMCEEAQGNPEGEKCVRELEAETLVLQFQLQHPLDPCLVIQT